MKLEHGDLTTQIIGAAIDVHRELGPGFLESIYERALVIGMQEKGLFVQQQMELPVYYNNIEVGRHRLDLFVEKTIVIGLKAIKELADIHFATVRSYLKAAGKKHELLLNFNRMPLEIKRVLYEP